MFVSFSHRFLPFASNVGIFEGLSLPSLRGTLPVWEGHRFDLRFLLVLWQGVRASAAGDILGSDSSTLVRDRRGVGRVLLDAANEIERGVERLVILRVRRDVGLRAGLLVAF